MSAEVIIESAGDHAFDLAHLRREGGEELVRLLLREAGHHGHCWRLRVEKKIACGAETRPVVVIGAKPWCCYLKIKPGDNNSGHYCSLLMPDGLKGEVVYEALKDAEERIDRNWRNGRKDKATVLPTGPAFRAGSPRAPREEDVPVRGLSEARHDRHDAARDDDVRTPRHLPETGRPPPVEQASSLADAEEPSSAATVESGSSGPEFANPPSPARTDLKDWTRDPEKLRLTLLAIHEVVDARSKTEFVLTLMDKLGWQGVNRYEVGGTFTGLVRQQLIEGVRRGSKDLGYKLTDKGKHLIHDLLPVEEEAAASPGPALPVAAGPALLGVAELVQKLSGPTQRLQAIQARRAELMAEIHRLDAEAREINKSLEHPEVAALVQRLLEVTAGLSPGPSTGP